MDRTRHWEGIYRKRPPTAQGWYTPVPQPSWRWIQEAANLPLEASILDVGGGASTLVDLLVESGYSDVTVLDLSHSALELARERMNEKASAVRWMVSDILQSSLNEESLDLWHDRAVFHFLHDTDERSLYRDKAVSAVRPGGMLILGSFRSGAPDTCSGLPVRKHSADDLASFFAPDFELVDSTHTIHTTPSGVQQAYVFGRLVRR